MSHGEFVLHALRVGAVAIILSGCQPELIGCAVKPKKSTWGHVGRVKVSG